MLAAAALIAGLFAQPKAARATTENATCPAAPTATFVTAERSCPALEVSGRIDSGGASLDPAFDVSVPPAELVRPLPEGALLAGYAADGRRIFALAVAANGPFHLYVPLAPASQQAIARVTLSNGAQTAIRDSSGPAEPAAEIISLDDHSVIVAWNARAFPEVRVRESPDAPTIATGTGSGTYEQLSVETHAHRLYVDFSDGVRSATRAFAIFGR